MKSCSENIWPDALTGSIFALEGIKDAVVILNGPTGCKFYHSAIADYQFPRDLSFDPLNYPEVYYFGQPRVPATFLDGYDYVYGASGKLEKILKTMKAKTYRLIAVVNSPGAALIGDDLDRFIRAEISGPVCISLENTGFSGCFTEGYEFAMERFLEALNPPPAAPHPRSVNLLGISIYHKHYSGSIKEIKNLLALTGIEVISTFCAGDTVATFQRCREAALNVVLYPEYGVGLARWMHSRYQIPYLEGPDGPPVGFRATEAFLNAVTSTLQVDPGPALRAIEQARAAGFLHVSRFNSVTGLPRGTTFALKAEPSLAYGLTTWLHRYLGMIPVAISLVETHHMTLEKRLMDYLALHNLTPVLDSDFTDCQADIVFADGNTLAQLRTQSHPFTGIETALPSLGYLDIVEKSILGPSGAMLFLEQILNGLRFIYG